MIYSVHEQRGCRIVTGPIPITDMVALMAAWSPPVPEHEDKAQEWIVCSDLAYELAATLVCGPREAIEAFRIARGIRPDKQASQET